MKTIPLVVVCTLMAACEVGTVEYPTDAELAPGEVHGDDGLAIESAVDVTTDQLARIDREDGFVVFNVDLDGPAAGAISTMEAFEPDPHGVVRVRSDDRSALEYFLALTDENVPVPRPLLAAERSEDVRALAANRAVVDRLANPILARTRETGPALYWSAATMCAEGTTSAMFKNEICTLNDHWTKNFCHNGTWYSVTDPSGSTHKSEWSRSLTLACGANGRARHYYKFWGVWYKPIDSSIPSGNVYQFTYEGTGIKLERSITHNRTASGFVRASSHYFRFGF